MPDTPPAVILVTPREEGNVGATARAMANMGLDELILVEPAPPLGGVAHGFGVGGWHVLERCRRAATFAEATAPFNRLVGTTSARERTLYETRLLTPRELPALLAAGPPSTTTALVFGPEDSGLTRDHLDRCAAVVAIPCAPEHPTLNLAQAVLILAYELRLTTLAGASHMSDTVPAGAAAAEELATEDLATAAETSSLLDHASRILLRIGYDQELVRGRVLRVLRHLAARAEIRSREVRVLRRLLNRTGDALAGRRRSDGAAARGEAR